MIKAFTIRGMKFNKILLSSLCLLLLAMSCRKDRIRYDIPTTYNFENVDISGQQQRMNMLAEMVEYMESARVQGTRLDSALLQEMYENQNNRFSFSSTKQLKNKVFLADQERLQDYLNFVARTSLSSASASNGIAGIGTSLDGTEHFLLDENGFDNTEMFEKGIMGAVFYYQATGYYMSESQIGVAVDNETVVPGVGTAMQHHWDEGFGYFGVSTSFPADLATFKYWGKACNDRDPILKTNTVMAEAFIKGRAAIDNDDHDTKNDQVTILRDTWERIVVGCAIHELNEAKSHLSDDALRNHEISEAIGYVNALKYNPTKKISDTQINDLIAGFGSNLYSVSLQVIDQSRSTLAGIYGLETVKDQL